MHSLQTIETLNSLQDIREYINERSLSVLYDADGVKKSPDYSTIDIEDIEKVTGKKALDTYFVDSSGFGSDSEAALTYPAFERIVTLLIKKHGRGKLSSCLTGAGQFQVYVTILK